MASTELKTIEKLVKDILEKVEKTDEQKINEEYEETFEKLNSKVEEISTKFEEKTENYIKELQDALEKIQNCRTESDNTDNSNNIKDFTSIITNELLELKEQFEKFNTEFTDISLNTGMAVSKEVVSLKNHVLALNDSVENIKTKLEEYKANEYSADKVLSDVEDVYQTAFGNFKKDVYMVLAKITEAVNDSLVNIDKLSEELKTFEGLELSVGEIIENQQKNKTEILKVFKNNIEEENKKLLPQIMQLVNSISFDESAEEIKDGLYAVNENLGIVNKNIEIGSKSTEQILGQIDDITKNVKTSNEEITTLVKEDLVNKLSQMNNFLSEVSNDFTALTKGTKEETNDYLYSLLDLESDISKVRVILEELNNTIQDDKSLAESITKNISDKISNLNTYVEQTSLIYTSPDYKQILTQMDTLNDDITSISKRTNKLILTSDDSSEKLQRNIEDFQKILEKISETVQNFEKSPVLKNLNTKTDSIQKLLTTSIQSDKAMKEAFGYLANWIDITSEEIKTIKTTVLLTEKTVKEIVKTPQKEDKSPEILTNIEELLQTVNKKLDENSARITAIEEKISKPVDNKKEISVIEKLSEQIQEINENIIANKTMSKKIDKIEKQIQQLLSFVEED
ncbi:hypothetical protein IJS77_03950 [bacterium]|nr:hypothetical protein [bacterium]